MLPVVARVRGKQKSDAMWCNTCVFAAISAVMLFRIAKGAKTDLMSVSKACLQDVTLEYSSQFRFKVFPLENNGCTMDGYFYYRDFLNF